MPIYEYACRKCDKKFSLVMTIGEHETKKPRCPKCKSLSVARRITPFYAQTSKKS